MDARTTRFAVADAKARFSELIARAEAGDEIVITRHGTLVARLTPIVENSGDVAMRRRRSREEYIAWVRADGPSLGPDVTLRQLIDEGRR